MIKFDFTVIPDRCAHGLPFLDRPCRWPMEPRKSLYRSWTTCWSWILIWNHTKEKSNDGKYERASHYRHRISGVSRLSSLPDIKYFKAFSSSWKQKKRESIPSHLPIRTTASTWTVEPTKSTSKNGHLLRGRCTFEEISVRSHRHSLSPWVHSSVTDNWQERQYPFTRDTWGVWRLTIPPLADGTTAIKHGQAIKVRSFQTFILFQSVPLVFSSTSCSWKHPMVNWSIVSVRGHVTCNALRSPIPIMVSSTIRLPNKSTNFNILNRRRESDWESTKLMSVSVRGRVKWLPMKTSASMFYLVWSDKVCGEQE